MYTNVKGHSKLLPSIVRIVSHCCCTVGAEGGGAANGKKKMDIMKLTVHKCVTNKLGNIQFTA